MKKLSFAKSIAVFGLAAVCTVGVAGCSEASTDGTGSTYTGGVAATVNGTEIQEDTITTAVENIRTQMGLTEEQAWGEWLAENDYTPESVRKEMIDGYVDQELVKQGSESLDIHADEAEVSQYVDSMRANYDSDEAWANALNSVGMTEEQYRENIALTLETQLLKEKVAEDAAEPTDEDLLTLAQTYKTSYDRLTAAGMSRACEHLKAALTSGRAVLSWSSSSYVPIFMSTIAGSDAPEICIIG